MNRRALWAGLLGGAVIAAGLYVWLGAEREPSAAVPEVVSPEPGPEIDNARLVPPEPASKFEHGGAPAQRDFVSLAVTGPQRVPVPDTFIPGPGEGLLRILVLARESREPLPGIRFFLKPASDMESISVGVRGIRTRSGGAPASGDDGVADLIVPAAQSYTLSVDGGREAESLELAIPALGVREQRDLTFELLTENDIPFFGVVVAFTDGAPIPHAEVLGLGGVRYPAGRARRSERGYQVLPVDSGGGFDVMAASWRGPEVRVHAEGFAEQTIALEAGHEVPRLARVIRLVANSSLQVSVLDSEGGPVAGIKLKVFSPPRLALGMSYAIQPEWEETTDADGTCTIGDAPSNETLVLKLFREGSLVHTEAQPLTLSPGEVRTVEITLGAGVSLHGLLLDQYEQPIENYAVWMRPDGGSELRLFEVGEAVQIKPRTDAQGRFVVQDIAAGNWLIGPAPRGATWGSTSPEGVAAEQKRIKIASSPLRQECVIRAQRGIYIRGRVVDESGNPLEHMSVSGDPVGAARVRGFSRGQLTPADGSFAIGPVGTAPHEITAYGGVDRRGRVSVIAQPGDNDVILRVEIGGGLSGIVRSLGGGEVAEARMELTTVGPDGTSVSWSVTTGTANGRFKFPNPRDGLHHLTARTADGRFGFLSGLQLSRNSSITDLELVVRPGGKLVCRYGGPVMQAGVTVWLGELEIGGGHFRDQGISVMTVPAGVLDIHFRRDFTQAREARTVEIAPGEELELVFR